MRARFNRTDLKRKAKADCKQAMGIVHLSFLLVLLTFVLLSLEQLLKKELGISSDANFEFIIVPFAVNLQTNLSF